MLYSPRLCHCHRVVSFDARMQQPGNRGLHQTLSKSWREFEEIGSFARMTVETAKRKLEKLRKRQYLRALFCYRIESFRYWRREWVWTIA